MTYNLPVTGNTNIAAVVPKGAEVLLETRLPYLSGEQRREVLRSTAIPSGHAVLNDVEGWGRLNLYAAADGYGAFKNDVTINMDAGLGGFAARDLWRNDIGGPGRLVKQGSGELVLTGDNSYRGGTQIEYGAIVAASSNALGQGGVTVIDGTLVDYAPLLLNVGGDYTQSHSATLEMIVGNGVDHLPRGPMKVRGNGRLGGHLRVTFTQAPQGKTLSFPLLSFKGNRKGEFNDVVVTGANGYTYSVSYGRDCVTLNLRRRSNRS
jgi:autotransporter-associated beta strand protein